MSMRLGSLVLFKLRQDVDVYEMFSGCGELGRQCRNLPAF